MNNLKYIIIFKNDTFSQPLTLDEARKIWKERINECLYLTIIWEKNK